VADLTCDECGRPIPYAGAKLCPACGYPIAPPENLGPVGVLRKPEAERPAPAERAGTVRPARVPQPPRMEVLGPYCPACHHRNGPHRIRCERCGSELWPGAASPPVRGRTLPVAAPFAARTERPWVTPVVFTVVALAALALVYVLTYTFA